MWLMRQPIPTRQSCVFPWMPKPASSWVLPQFDELFLACVTSKVTSDCLVDVLELGWQSVRERFEQIRTLVINLDNGPENQSHRTQFLNRLVAFAQTYQLTVKLA